MTFEGAENWVGMTLVGGAFVWMLRVFTTKLDGRFGDIAKAIRQQTLGYAMAAESVVAMQKMLLVHTSTVHGINPSTGDTDDERAKALKRQYDEIRAILEESSAHIQAFVNQAAE